LKNENYVPLGERWDDWWSDGFYVSFTISLSLLSSISILESETMVKSENEEEMIRWLWDDEMVDDEMVDYEMVELWDGRWDEMRW